MVYLCTRHGVRYYRPGDIPKKHYATRLERNSFLPDCVLNIIMSTYSTLGVRVYPACLYILPPKGAYRNVTFPVYVNRGTLTVPKQKQQYHKSIR